MQSAISVGDGRTRRDTVREGGPHDPAHGRDIIALRFVLPSIKAPLPEVFSALGSKGLKLGNEGWVHKMERSESREALRKGTKITTASCQRRARGGKVLKSLNPTSSAGLNAREPPEIRHTHID